METIVMALVSATNQQIEIALNTLVALTATWSVGLLFTDSIRRLRKVI